MPSVRIERGEREHCRPDLPLAPCQPDAANNKACRGVDFLAPLMTSIVNLGTSGRIGLPSWQVLAVTRLKSFHRFVSRQLIRKIHEHGEAIRHRDQFSAGRRTCPMARMLIPHTVAFLTFTTVSVMYGDIDHKQAKDIDSICAHMSVTMSRNRKGGEEERPVCPCSLR